jgi:predicted TIM-barrel fold metal-dependent hydrolase
MATTATLRATEQSDRATARMLIDTDVHEMFRSVADLKPYVARRWQHMFGSEDYWWRGSPESGLPYAAPISKGRREWILEDGNAGWDPAALARHLFVDEGVTLAILNGGFRISAMPCDHEFAVAIASAYNDWGREFWLDSDPRLRGSVHVIAHLPELAAKEIDRVAKDPRIVQVFLPLVNDRQYGDPFYRPIFEAAVRNDLVVALHHGSSSQPAIPTPRQYIEWHTNAPPQIGACQLTSMICNGLFDKFPDLKVMFLETGVSWVPSLMWRLDQQYREVRDSIPWVKRMPSDHIREQVRFSTQPITEVTAKQFAQLTEMSATERVWMFSTDYPHYDADSVVVLDGLPPDLRRRLEYQNALESYPRLSDLS